MNSRFCPVCNKIKNLLYNAAKRKSKVELLSKELENDVSCKRLFERYRAKCGVDKVKPGSFLLEYEEEVGAKTRVRVSGDQPGQ